MTTGWLVVNIVLIAVVAAIVTIPAVLIPNILHRQTLLENRETQLERAQRAPTHRRRPSTRQPVPSRARSTDGQRRQVA